jgi:hypothetical protein
MDEIAGARAARTERIIPGRREPTQFGGRNGGKKLLILPSAAPHGQKTEGFSQMKPRC